MLDWNGILIGAGMAALIGFLYWAGKQSLGPRSPDHVKSIRAPAPGAGNRQMLG